MKKQTGLTIIKLMVLLFIAGIVDPRSSVR